jgi:hypothetical protein
MVFGRFARITSALGSFGIWLEGEAEADIVAIFGVCP